MSAGRWLLALCLIGGAEGCVVSRQIKEVEAHPTYNNYKVQALTVRFAGITAWQQWEAWTCHKEGGAFVCEKVDYDAVKQGSRWEGPPAPAPSASPEEPRPTPSVSIGGGA